MARRGNAATGALHLALAVGATRLLHTDDAGAGTDAAAKGAATLLARPFGQALVALGGLVVLGLAGWQGVQAARGRFRREARAYLLLGRLGFAAHDGVLALVGLFLLAAARHANPADARSRDGALASLVGRPFGPWLLGAVAAGFIANGLFLVAEARYHRIRVTRAGWSPVCAMRRPGGMSHRVSVALPHGTR